MIRSWENQEKTNGVAVGEKTIGVIQTFGGSGQADGSRAGWSPLLVGVPAEAGEDLHLLSIGGHAVRVVKAFVTKDLQGSASDGPQLVDRFRMGTSYAVRNLNGGAVSIGSSDETLGGVAGGVDERLAGGRSGQDGGSEGEECESRELHGEEEVAKGIGTCSRG
jgi:hypothetical protein